MSNHRVENVVLVHGAFADGSGWRRVYEDLTSQGYRVTVVQNPLTSLEDDVAATKRILDRQDGPTILVGHSWGGTVITEAGTHPHVAGLVYVSALAPDTGETTAQQYAGFASTPDFVIDGLRSELGTHQVFAIAASLLSLCSLAAFIRQKRLNPST